MTVQLLTVQQQGFETDGSGYPTLVNCATAQSAVQAQAGTKSLALTSTAGGTMTATTLKIPVMPGRSYTFAAWVRAAVSARNVNVYVSWYQSDGVTASLITIFNQTTNANDSAAAWTQFASTPVVAPLDAFYATVQLSVTATGAGAEVHYFDTVSFLDTGSYFKHGRRANLYLNGVDISSYFHDAAFNAKAATADVTTFTANWKSYLVGEVEATLVAAGYYDSLEADKVRSTLQGAVGQLTYYPAGAQAIGDQARLLNINSSDYKTGSKMGGAVTMDWTALATTPVGFGELLHVLQAENVGTITGTGTPLAQGISTATGAVAHLQVTLPGGVQNFKLQDSTALNGAYADIAGGAFAAQSVVGSQRLVIPGTIRAYVRAVATIITAPCTYSISAART